MFFRVSLRSLKAWKARLMNWTPAQNERRDGVGGGERKKSLRSLPAPPRVSRFAFALLADSCLAFFFALKNRETVNSLQWVLGSLFFPPYV